MTATSRTRMAPVAVALEMRLLEDELETLERLRKKIPRKILIERRDAACARLKALEPQVELIEFEAAREWMKKRCIKVTLDIITCRLKD
jgi:hypothetical protein